MSALFQLFSEEYSPVSGLRVIATPLFELVLAGRGTRRAKSVLLNILNHKVLALPMFPGKREIFLGKSTFSCLNIRHWRYTGGTVR